MERKAVTATIKFEETEIRLVAMWINEKPSSWDSMSHKQHHRIKVIANGGKSVSFDYWASQAHPRIETEKEVIEAFNCFVSDAMSGTSDFKDFCSELGYDEYIENDYGRSVQNKDAKRIHSACVKAKKDFDRVVGVDIYDLSNWMSEEFEL